MLKLIPPFPRKRNRSSGSASRGRTDNESTVHASAVLVGARAVLIRGPSGSGKSRLALELIEAGHAGRLRFARLVADDRVHLEAAGGQIAGAPGRGIGRPDRGARRRTFAGAARGQRGGRSCGRSRRRGRKPPPRSRPAQDGNRRYFAAATCRRGRCGGLAGAARHTQFIGGKLGLSVDRRAVGDWLTAAA